MIEQFTKNEIVEIFGADTIKKLAEEPAYYSSCAEYDELDQHWISSIDVEVINNVHGFDAGDEYRVEANYKLILPESTKVLDSYEIDDYADWTPKYYTVQ